MRKLAEKAKKKILSFFKNFFEPFRLIPRIVRDACIEAGSVLFIPSGCLLIIGGLVSFIFEKERTFEGFLISFFLVCGGIAWIMLGILYRTHWKKVTKK